jgi:succinate dehydrogenase cytochrome b subunit
MASEPRPITPNLGQRPLSPHLQVYHFGWTMAFSIFHRITGVGLSLGTLVLVWWLVSLMRGPEAYADARLLMAHPIGRFLLFGWNFALFYHLCNGIRHLTWDAGWGLDKDTAQTTAWIGLASALVLLLVAWSWGYGLIGGAA